MTAPFMKLITNPGVWVLQGFPICPWAVFILSGSVSSSVNTWASDYNSFQGTRVSESMGGESGELLQALGGKPKTRFQEKYVIDGLQTDRYDKGRPSPPSLGFAWGPSPGNSYTVKGLDLAGCLQRKRTGHSPPGRGLGGLCAPSASKSGCRLLRASGLTNRLPWPVPTAVLPLSRLGLLLLFSRYMHIS